VVLVGWALYMSGGGGSYIFVLFVFLRFGVWGCVGEGVNGTILYGVFFCSFFFLFVGGLSVFIVFYCGLFCFFL